MSIVPSRDVRRALGACLAATFAAAASASAQDAGWVPWWLSTPIAPGHETEYAAALGRALPGWSHDALGTWWTTRGSGAPHRVVACALDRPAYAVSEIRDDGLLRVHDPAGRKPHPLWDNFHEGQRIAILAHDASGAERRVPGVFAVRSTHLARGRTSDTLAVAADDLWLDVGARSRAEVGSLGIRLLDAVVREASPSAYGDGLVAAPGAAATAACRAVALAAAAPAAGTTTFVLAAQSTFGWAGLSAALARLAPVDSLTLVEGAPSADTTAATSRGAPRPVPRFAAGHVPRAVASLTVRARFPGSLVETVSRADADALVDAVRRVGNVGGGSVLAPTASAAGLRGPWTAARAGARADAYGTQAALLAHFADVYAVSAHEERMRDAVLRELPEWARRIARVDTAGNVVVAAGPERDTTVFVAHVDEIGFEITSIARDGTVALRMRGGGYLSLWEGQRAVVHLDGATMPVVRAGAASCPRDYRDGTPADVRGVFVPRAARGARVPRELTAWFGVDSAALVAQGVRVGQSVTAEKCATRLAATRFTARAIDDRAGVTALVLALRAIDPARLTRRTVFAFSTREETGLSGAAALAADLGPSVRRVYAVDTFVSSDSPIESTRFAGTPLGAGAVVRALDNSSATPPAEVARVVRIARAAQLPVQIGTTNGGNDGSELVRLGAVDVPLSWPGRYSHSPVEMLDLRDLDALARLVAALATSRD